MKRIFILLTVFALALSLTACGEDKEAQPENLQNNTDGAKVIIDQTDDNQQDWNDNSDMMQNNSQDIKLSVAQIAERDFIFVLKSSQLEQLAGLDRGVYTSYYINFGENNHISMSPNETSGNQFRIKLDGIIGGEEGYDCLMIGKIAGDTAKMMFRVPEEAGFDWNKIDSFDVSYPINTEGLTNSTTVKKADAEVDASTLEVPAPLSELSAKNANISISTKDNGDGTITVTYNDSTVKPNYIYPWDWVQRDSFANSNYRIYIEAKLPEGVVFYASLYGDGGKKLRYGDMNYDLWDGMIFNIAELYKNKDTADNLDDAYILPEITSTFDENGMTLVWSAKAYDGRSANDITEFKVELQYYVNGASFSEEFVNELVTFNLEATNGVTN